MLRIGKNTSLLAGIVAALGASVCCVGPLVLLMLGVGGTWIGNLTLMQPFRPVFIVLTLGFLGLAFHRLYLKPPVCMPNTPCADPRVIRSQKVTFWFVCVLLLGLLAVPQLAVWFY